MSAVIVQHILGRLWDVLPNYAHIILTSTHRADLTPALKLARSLHPTPPAAPAAILTSLDAAPHALPALARFAQAGDRHALLMAAVLMRGRLRAIAGRLSAGDDNDRAEDVLLTAFALLRTSAEPDMLTEPFIAAQVAKRLRERPSGPDAAIPCDPDASVFNRPAPEFDQPLRRATQLLDSARAKQVITDLEYRTLRALYLQSDTFNLYAAAGTLQASAAAVERRAQRAIHKLREALTSTRTAA